jgi:hypothetical protein
MIIFLSLFLPLARPALLAVLEPGNLELGGLGMYGMCGLLRLSVMESVILDCSK